MNYTIILNKQNLFSYFKFKVKNKNEITKMMIFMLTPAIGIWPISFPSSPPLALFASVPLCR
jgi:hypothetical protein